MLRVAPAGTDNEMLLNDPFYIGLRHKCVRSTTAGCPCFRNATSYMMLTPALRRVQARAWRAVR